MSGNNNVTSRQMALFTFVVQTGVGVILLPSFLAKEVGHDGWISVLITGGIAVLFSALIVILLKRYADKAIYDINKLIFGKAIGFVLNVLLILYLLVASIGGLRIFVIYLRVILMPKTPVGVLTTFLILPSVYLIWEGLKYVCRFKYFTMISYIGFLLYIAFIIKELRFSFLLPIGEAGTIPILSSIKTSFFSFLGLELIVFFFPEITDKHKVLKWHIAASGISMLFFLIVVLASTAVFGENFLKVQTLSTFNLTRIYNAPVFERVDLYLLGIWFVAMGCSVRGYIFAAYYSLQKVFNLKKTKLFHVLFFGILVLASRVSQDMNETFKVLEIINLIGIGVSVFLVLCLLLSFIRKKGVRMR